MTLTASSGQAVRAQVTTVTGPVGVDAFRFVDAHTHVWIDAVAGAQPGSPVLDQHGPILAEVIAFREAGGSALVDCQPGGCGRNGSRLIQVSRESGVPIIASTGFHRPRYYPPDFLLWHAGAEEITAYFLAEIHTGLEETLALEVPARAGLIKIACEASLGDTAPNALEAAVEAARESGLAVEVHTERGEAAEDILRYFTDRGVSPQQLVLCHMDKRPDLGLHQELARAGVLLEYDTFYRPKYAPETRAWPLIAAMVARGFEDSLALATDSAEAALWKHLGGGPGLAGLLTLIVPRCAEAGLNPVQVEKVFGRNIICRLARPALIHP